MMADNEQNEGTSDNTGSESRKRESISIFREFIIVIIGALIALAADDYQEASERADRDHQVMVMIQNELQANLDLIQQTNNYHEKIFCFFARKCDSF